ncbi:hypothetical protein [Flavobacterium sp. UBA7663]|uniref:hypothetical protein n=1 Tax=Flavobacterium sp. UBA7663 TaxID=1946557 RepID=UPI0025BDE894|nr:hypothetical protein [Flavobacterium sp. UBA7663]
MNKREIILETNNFQPGFSGNFIFDQKAKKFLNKIEIDLDELCAKFLLEEFDDLRPVKFYGQFPALNYLIENIREFKFEGAHPGASKDPRKENSRVLGQTICRYFVEKTFGTGFMANIGTLLGRKLPPEFAHISVDRIQEGDTPDFLFIDNNNAPCLAEAKGRRTAVPFSDNKFDTWRKQFEKIEVKINGSPTEVKGYITELAIANEDNKMSNSIFYVEDPKLEGKEYNDGNLDQLIKLAHYERILARTYLNFVGNSLLSNEKLSQSKNYGVRVFKVAGIEALRNHEIVPLYEFLPNRFFLKNAIFIGISFAVLKNLLHIARGNQIGLYESVKYINFNSVFFQFIDGFTVCNSNLLEYVERREI